MKATEQRLKAALAAPSPDIRLYLLHGPDEAAAAAHASTLGKALGISSERLDVDAATLRADPARLSDEAASISLFGEPRWVRVTGAGEESLEATRALLDAAQAGNPVVMLAPGLRTTAKLVKLAIESDRALAFACYPPEGRSAEQLALELAREEGVRLSADAARWLVSASDGDRAIMAREVTKLALFLDAAPDRPRDADRTTWTQIGADLVESEIGQVVDAVMVRDAAALGLALRTERDADTSAVPILRALARRLSLLAEMRADVDRGEGPEQVVKRHRVFWREEASYVAALGRWSAPDLARAQAQVRQVERAAMSGSDAARARADQGILTLVSAAGTGQRGLATSR